mmetsp:Transcript_6227/g.15009  ORF Transcript_6227/g.15009 Transcript_6227/m.15009 type:complete len:153 (-) Transcript_6227:176-634(-)
MSLTHKHCHPAMAIHVLRVCQCWPPQPSAAVSNVTHSPISRQQPDTHTAAKQAQAARLPCEALIHPSIHSLVPSHVHPWTGRTHMHSTQQHNTSCPALSPHQLTHAGLQPRRTHTHTHMHTSDRENRHAGSQAASQAGGKQPEGFVQLCRLG